MAGLQIKISDDLRTALRQGEGEKVSVLRLLQAALKNVEIEKGKRDIGLSDEETLEVVQRETKKRHDAAELYRKGGRPELAEKEKMEVSLLKAYLPFGHRRHRLALSHLPRQLSSDELRTIVADVLKGGETNMGKIMGIVMAKVKGKADGTAVRKMVEEMLK